MMTLPSCGTADSCLPPTPFVALLFLPCCIARFCPVAVLTFPLLHCYFPPVALQISPPPPPWPPCCIANFSLLHRYLFFVALLLHCCFSPFAVLFLPYCATRQSSVALAISALLYGCLRVVTLFFFSVPCYFFPVTLLHMARQ